MRIFVQPRNGDSFRRVFARALTVLQDAHLTSAEGGGSFNDRPAMVVDPSDLTQVLEILERAGMRVIVH
jgi:hypothetical protein